jgi:antitoxin ParD1/3/4
MPSSYSLGRHFECFIDRLVRTGRYASASEVMRDSMRLLEQREQLREVKLEALRAEKQASTAALPGRSTWRRTRPKPARNEAPRAMPAEILWPPQARLDLIEIWNDIADDDEAAADRMLDRIDGILRMLSERPKAGRERTGACLGLRSFRPEFSQHAGRARCACGIFKLRRTYDAEVSRPSTRRPLWASRELDSVLFQR